MRDVFPELATAQTEEELVRFVAERRTQDSAAFVSALTGVSEQLAPRAEENEVLRKLRALVEQLLAVAQRSDEQAAGRTLQRRKSDVKPKDVQRLLQRRNSEIKVSAFNEERPAQKKQFEGLDGQKVQLFAQMEQTTNIQRELKREMEKLKLIERQAEAQRQRSSRE